MDYSEAETDQGATGARFDDPRNITHRGARVIWSRACHPVGRDPQPEGWVLPGGRRTSNRSDASAAAMVMDELMTSGRW